MVSLTSSTLSSTSSFIWSLSGLTSSSKICFIWSLRGLISSSTSAFTPSQQTFTVLVPSTRDSSPKALHNILANHTPLQPRPLPPLPPFPPLGRLPNFLASISEAIIKANKHMPKQTLKFILLIYFEAFSNISCSCTGAQIVSESPC